LYEFTREVASWVEKIHCQDGLLTLHLRHTSASLLIQENADPDVRRDLEAFFQRLVPDGDALYVHTAEGDDDMPAHVRTALTAVNLSIPVREGRLTLGTWQGIYVWEHRTASHTRRIAAHFIGE
jgi:secondary thiamine-phosphate synthase enzyme